MAISRKVQEPSVSVKINGKSDKINTLKSKDKRVWEMRDGK